VIISSFVALTLSPMLSSKILKRRETHNWFYNKTEQFFISLTNGYTSTLEVFMRVRWLAFAIILALAGGIYGLYKAIPSELAPIEDRNNVRMFATGPQGATFTYMDRYMDSLIYLVQDTIPQRKAVISVTSPGFGANTSKNSGFMRLMMTDKSKRETAQQQIAGKLSELVPNIPGARTFVTQEQTIGGGFGGQPVAFVIQAPNMNKLKQVLPKFMDRVEEQEMFRFTDVNLKFNKPELDLTFDREQTRKLGVNAKDLAQTLQLAFSNQRMGYFIMDGKQYQIIGQVKDRKRDEPSDLKNLYVRNKDGQLIPIDNLVNLKEESGPPTIYRYNRYVSATVSASLAGEHTIGQGISKMRTIANDVLDQSFSTALSGTSKDYAESASSLVFAFVLALLIIFLVLSAQFESFRDPLIIMLTVPLALSGALLVIWTFNETLNIFSQIGIIMLIGLVTKNAILIVEFSNQQKAQGYGLRDAVMIGATRRFRPILMTSISTILGISPLVLGGGAGSESRASMGIAVIGGLIFATLLSLYIIPAVYTYRSEQKKAVSNVDEIEQ
jgi:multidrug efflux pump